jgi:arsenite methyltransferase
MPKLATVPAAITERESDRAAISQFIQVGETVLALSGGKFLSIASQIVGPKGQVIGIGLDGAIGDMPELENVELRKASIHDLALDLEAFDEYLTANPIRSADDWIRAEAHAEELRQDSPLVEDESIDVIVADGVLESVSETNRERFFSELFRVLRIGGRAVIRAIVCDELVTHRLEQNQAIESNGLSGAFLESELFGALEAAGFHGLQILDRQEDPLAVLEGIEFRRMTIASHKGESGECLDGHHAVIYRGPWKAVLDDEGQTLHRGERMAVCARSFERFTQPPYANELIAIEPQVAVAEQEMQPMDCRSEKTRDPRVSKGLAPCELASHSHSHHHGDSCC